jgi:hypothetical protein
MTAVSDLIYEPISKSTNGIGYSINPVDNLLSKIPKCWFDVLGKIQNIYGWKDATIAGGALRDLDLGRAIKDVDIFVPSVLINAADLLKQEFPTCYITEKNHIINSNSVVHQNGVNIGGPIPSHFEFYMNGWRFEITQCIIPFIQKEIIRSFDVGLCMIALHDGNIYRASGYITDAINNTISILNDTGGSVLHAERIQNKYEGWNIISP